MFKRTHTSSPPSRPAANARPLVTRTVSMHIASTRTTENRSERTSVARYARREKFQYKRRDDRRQGSCELPRREGRADDVDDRETFHSRLDIAWILTIRGEGRKRERKSRGYIGGIGFATATVVT